ncbi:FTR1 family protein [Bacillus sp. NPDC093026]|uniref:FTR1 family iron permease n=1 Tax=Bacillus sp. NPDC093026 TaxID=3363948 RepID=UPI0038255194
MKEKLPVIFLLFFVSFSALFIPSVHIISAKQTSENDIHAVIAHVVNTDQALDDHQLQTAKKEINKVKSWWNQNKSSIKKKSLSLSTEIESQLAKVSLALVTDDTKEATKQLVQLKRSLENYRDGAFVDNQGKTTLTLKTYIQKLEHTRTLIDQKNWQKAEQEVQSLSSQWLSVEGDVVSQSQVVYDDTERDLLLLVSYVQTEDKREKAGTLIDQMVAALKPLVDANYTMWDAALIPIREGMEAILVVGALLTLSRKAESKYAARWVIGGSAVGIAISLILGILVVILFTSSAFGTNNMLINGWSGVLASFLLVYVSYWLHRYSDIARWNAYLNRKSAQAISTKKMIGFAALACLAILREGLETVFFLIGMAGKMEISQLVSGIIIGFGVLSIMTIMMMKLGTRLPLKPFFLCSSVIVFYLCFKFMGSGIHSLQLAGVLPTSVSDYLPSIQFISVYPSWYSTLPQLALLIGAVIVVCISIIQQKHHSQHTEVS